MNPIGSIGAVASPPAQAVGAPHQAPPTDPSVLKAARDFESIFVRQMLKSLEKTTAAGAGTKAAAGQSTYGSMVVDTLSDAISKAGGLGLADVIASSMMAAHPTPSAQNNPGGAAESPAASLIPTLKAPK